MTEQPAALAVELQGVVKRFGGTVALDGVSFAARVGVTTGVLGPNGSGKTTSLRHIAGLLEPDDGEVRIFGERANGLSPQERFRRGVVQTFQRVALAENLSVTENVIVGADGRRLSRPRRLLADLMGGDPSALRGVDLGPVLDVMVAVGIEAHADEQVGNLPLGLRRRVELARALVAEPRLLLLDEPTSGLDVTESAEFVDVLAKATRRDPDLTLVLIEHDLSVVAGVCDDIVVLDFGQVIATGDVSSVFADPTVRSAFLGTADV